MTNQITIPKDFPVRPLKPSQKAEDRVTCGTCGRSWDDAIPTSYTPAPSARCPFEAFHTAPVPSEQEAEPVTITCPDGAVYHRTRYSAPSEQEVTPELPSIKEQAERIVSVWRATDQHDKLLAHYIKQAINDNLSCSHAELKERVRSLHEVIARQTERMDDLPLYLKNNDSKALGKMLDDVIFQLRKAAFEAITADDSRSRCSQ